MITLDELDHDTYHTPEKDYYVVRKTRGWDVHKMDTPGMCDGEIVTHAESIGDAAFSIMMHRGIPQHYLLAFITVCTSALIFIAGLQLLS